MQPLFCAGTVMVSSTTRATIPRVVNWRFSRSWLQRGTISRPTANSQIQMRQTGSLKARLMPGYLTREQVADRLNVSVMTIKRHIKAGSLKAVNLSPTNSSKLIRIRIEDFEAFERKLIAPKTLPQVKKTGGQLSVKPSHPSSRRVRSKATTTT